MCWIWEWMKSQECDDGVCPLITPTDANDIQESFCQKTVQLVLLTCGQGWRGVAYCEAWQGVRGDRKEESMIWEHQSPQAGWIFVILTYSVTTLFNAYHRHHSRPWGHSSKQSSAFALLTFQRKEKKTNTKTWFLEPAAWVLSFFIYLLCDPGHVTEPLGTSISSVTE